MLKESAPQGIITWPPARLKSEASATWETVSFGVQ